MHLIQLRRSTRWQIHCQTSAAQKKSYMRECEKKENLVIVTINAAAFLGGIFASIWNQRGTSVGSGSWGCTYGEWLIPWDYDPCRCTTEINQKSHQALSVIPSAAFEAFIKSTPLGPILAPLPGINIYHRLKVHLLVHQGFGDLCRLLEMDVIWRKHSHFTTWPNIKANIFHQGKYSPLDQGFYRVTLMEHWRILSCSLTEKNNSVWMKQRNRTICRSVNQEIANCFEVLCSGCHRRILLGPHRIGLSSEVVG